MKKIKILIALVLFIFIGKIGAEKIQKMEIDDLINEQNEYCQILKSQNKKISDVLDKILNGLRPEQESYQEMKKFRNLAQKAEELIDEIQKLVDGLPNERDEEILLQDLPKIEEKCNQVGLIHKLLNNVLRAIFAPWLEKKPAGTIV